ncbi:hypothetical protein RhiirA4_481581 [Rhizophagus irregularis]|uniref:Uncharacterized protein n=1 Tax=Rhizophagus irregularis TaxID=588596 RepID=A0A2I1HJQ0_9GLOM|nr:hypothetical protein RhiirA4_481581 [Rhizophagus irregularis]
MQEKQNCDRQPFQTHWIKSSCCGTCHILLGLPLYHSSRQFVFLNLNKEAARWICGTGESEKSYSVNDSGQTEKSPLKIYWDRPTELEDFTLFQLHLTHKLIKGRWKECQQENIVHVFSRLSPLCEDPQWEEFCRVKVLLHVIAIDTKLERINV